MGLVGALQRFPIGKLYCVELYYIDILKLRTYEQASLDRDISLKALNSLFKATIDIYLRFLGIAYIKMCHDRQLSVVIALVTSYACTACSGELI